jgi:hypothetical protein
MSFQGKIGIKARRIWHDLYYSLTFRPGLRFALRCQQAAEIIDLGETPPTLFARFRFVLHLSLCQACKNYFDSSQDLKKAIKNSVLNQTQKFDMLSFNRELVKKYSQSKDNLRK